MDPANGANNHILHTGIEIGLYRIGIANTTTDLDRQITNQVAGCVGKWCYDTAIIDLDILCQQCGTTAWWR